MEMTSEKKQQGCAVYASNSLRGVGKRCFLFKFKFFSRNYLNIVCSKILIKRTSRHRRECKNNYSASWERIARKHAKTLSNRDDKKLVHDRSDVF